MVLGRVREIWRYPFKSMAGETLDRAVVGADGIAGDRGWAVRDEGAGEIRGAKKLPALMGCSARYLAEPDGDGVPGVEVTLPDGRRLRSGGEELAEALSSLLGRPVTVWPRQPAENSDHYRRGEPDHPDMLDELRQVFGRLPDEPLPDLTKFGDELLAELTEYASPRGTYFDAAPLHLLTTASLEEVSRRNPGARFDVRRFRPNVLVESPGEAAGFVEQDWCGKRLRMGAVEVEVTMPCPRCVMTTIAQSDLPKDPTVLRTIVAEAGQSLGVYAVVRGPARLAVGDELTLG